MFRSQPRLKKWVYHFFAILLLHGILILIEPQKVFAQEEGMKCSVVLDGSDKWENANEQCIKSNKVDESKLEDVSFNVTLEEFEFDDNCFIQCVYTNVGILTPDGYIDKNQTMDIFKGNTTAEMFEKTVSIWDTCIEEADKTASVKGLNPCKTLSLHDFCFNKMVVENGILDMEC